MVGVGFSFTSRLLYTPIACEQWSSDMIKRIFGRPDATQSDVNARHTLKVNAPFLFTHICFNFLPLLELNAEDVGRFAGLAAFGKDDQVFVGLLPIDLLGAADEFHGLDYSGFVRITLRQ